MFEQNFYFSLGPAVGEFDFHVFVAFRISNESIRIKMSIEYV